MGIFGKKQGAANVSMAYPYFEKETSPEDALAAMRATEARLKWDGTKHVWVN